MTPEGEGTAFLGMEEAPDPMALVWGWTESVSAALEPIKTKTAPPSVEEEVKRLVESGWRLNSHEARAKTRRARRRIARERPPGASSLARAIDRFEVSMKIVKSGLSSTCADALFRQ